MQNCRTDLPAARSFGFSAISQYFHLLKSQLEGELVYVADGNFSEAMNCYGRA
jgi:hypothetical protein